MYIAEVKSCEYFFALKMSSNKYHHDQNMQQKFALNLTFLSNRNFEISQIDNTYTWYTIRIPSYYFLYLCWVYISLMIKYFAKTFSVNKYFRLKFTYS